MVSHSIVIDLSDPRGRRLAEALGVQRTGAGVATLTGARAKKWQLLMDAGFDASQMHAANKRPGFTRKGGNKLLLSEAVMVAQAIAETRAECAKSAARE